MHATKQDSKQNLGTMRPQKRGIRGESQSRTSINCFAKIGSMGNGYAELGIHYAVPVKPQYRESVLQMLFCVISRCCGKDCIDGSNNLCEPKQFLLSQWGYAGNSKLQYKTIIAHWVFSFKSLDKDNKNKTNSHRGWIRTVFDTEHNYSCVV